MIGAGELRHQVKLEKQTTVSDGAGGTITTWVEVTTTPARLIFLRGTETVMAGRLQGTETVVVTVRNQPDLATAATTWRLTSTRSGRVYNIKSISNTTDDAFVEFLCETGAT